ncbi:MAG: zf-HC2 domain-containing protein [Clostridia bacterium]|nr:zf-HC2 domain-containing protein [Clostridia bacterium]
MRLNCDQAREMLAEYLDNSLLPEDRQRLQLHLDHCESCRTDLELQQAWLQEARPLILKDPDFQSAADLSQRIRASLDRMNDSGENHSSVSKETPVYSGRRIWPRRLVLTAAAMLVLFFGVYAFSELYQNTMGRPSKTGSIIAMGADSAQEDGAEEPGGVKGLGMDDELASQTDSMVDLGDDQPVIRTESLLQDTGWTVYQGSLADLPIGSGLFVRPSSDPISEETSATETSEPRDSADPQTGTVLAAELLTSARDIRVLVRPDPPETLIYSFWQNGDGDAFWQQVQIERNDWPYHTQIVRMPARGEADNIRELLGPDLAAEVLRDVELDNSEIIQILIGASDFD